MMLDIPIFWSFLILLAAHYMADFPLQTHWQASNKSKNNAALLEHVAVYTAVLAVVSGILFGFGAMWFVFCWINGVLHFCTDYCTSRWSASYFAPAVRHSSQAMTTLDTYRLKPNERYAVERLAGATKDGLDQLIHQVTLGITLWLIVA